MANNVYKKEKSPLYNLSSRKKICELFNISNYNLLKQLEQDENNYNVFSISKGNDAKRTVEEPNRILKKFQKDFNRFLQRIEVPTFVKAGIKGCCHIHNGQTHMNGKYFYATDIKKFFPNTKKENVFQFLLYDMKMKNDIAFLFSNILTYDNHLPTGSPSSQLLTYWAYRKTFADIHNLACELKITMTLFVDDLQFSSESLIPKEFINYVSNRLKSENLNVNKKKCKLSRNNSYKKITGTIVTPENKLVVPNRQCAKIRVLKNKTNKTNPEIKSLKGMLSSARQIEPKFMDNYYKELMNIG